MSLTSGDRGEWGRLGKTGRDVESGGHCYRLEGAGGSQGDGFREGLGTLGRTLDTAGWGLRVFASRRLIGSKGRFRSSAGRGWEATAVVGATHRWGAQAAGQDGRAGQGSRGNLRRRGAACARGPVRSRLSRVGPGAGRREGRGGGGRDEAPPLNRAPGLWRPLVGSGREPSRGG